jgi:hypothetical protein
MTTKSDLVSNQQKVNANEHDYLDVAEREQLSSSDYITIKDHATLKFDTSVPMPTKRDTYQGKPAGVKTFFTAVEVSSPNPEGRTWKANRRSAPKIFDALRESKKPEYETNLLSITRNGEGTETVYEPHLVRMNGK